jgi:hypothetical protein
MIGFPIAALLDDNICAMLQGIQATLNETVPTEAMTGTALEAGEGKSASVGLR